MTMMKAAAAAVTVTQVGKAAAKRGRVKTRRVIRRSELKKMRTAVCQPRQPSDEHGGYSSR
jgi:hypothetical protein